MSATGGSYFPGFDYKPARRPYSYDIFLSSSDEVAFLRDRVEDLIRKSFTVALSLYSNAQVSIVRWEQAVAGGLPGETLNDVFVRTALECHHTLVLLMTHLGPGTREEVEAVVKANKPLSIVRFELPKGHSSEHDPREIDAFIDALGKPYMYERCGPPNSVSAWQGLSKTLAAITIGMYKKFLDETTDPMSELRG